MNKSINPLLAFAVVAFFATIFAVHFWLNQKTLTMERFSNAHMSRAETLAVQYGKQILQVDLLSGNASQLDLGDLGINESIGDFEFFSDGDLLIRISALERSSLDAAAAVFRIRNHKQVKGSAESGALYRCKLTSRECELFGDELPVMNRSFRLAIDRNTDTVFLADTSRHQLFKLDSAGKVLAKKTGFNFPNQALFVDGKLWLADTNNHRVVELDSSDANFGVVLNAHENSLSGVHEWPFTLARVGSNWWVNIADDEMANGRIATYDAQWNPLGEIELPIGADPIALQTYGDRVLVTDNRLFRIYQFDLTGKMLEDLHIPALAGELLAQKEQVRKYKQYGYLCWFLGLIAFVIGFYFGIKEQLITDRQLRKERESKPAAASGARTLPTLPVSGEWIEPGRYMKLLGWLFALAVIALMGSIAALALTSEKPTLPITWPLLMVSLAFLPMFLPLLRLSKFRIGVFDNRLAIVDHHQRSCSDRWEEVLWTDQMIKIDEYVIPLGNGKQQGIFPRKRIDALIKPRLSYINKITKTEALHYQWRSPEGMYKGIVIMLVWMCISILILERESLLNVIKTLFR